MNLLNLDPIGETPDFSGPKPMAKDEFILKTKALLSAIMEGYSAHWRDKFSEDDEDNACERCGGGTQIEQGGDIVDCPSCKGTGVSSERVFDGDGFVEFMEHEVMFGTEPFLELMECEILPELPKQDEK